jgi:putative glutathione S-transferase
MRNWISDRPGARLRPQAGRYHLYVMYGCPWAHRALIVRALKGLEERDRRHRGPLAPGRGAGLGLLARRARAVLRRRPSAAALRDGRSGIRGRVTVPVLWDRQERTIVNNESSEIIRMLNGNGAFNAFAAHPDVDLYPAPLRAEIDRWNERIYAAVNAGVYRAWFADTQDEYDAAVRTFFAALDEIEAHLATHRFLVGDRPTEADWRLFPTLLRFEWIYHGLFKCNLRRLVDYPNLFAYARELYQWPGIAATIRERDIRHGYFTSMRKLNPSGIVPAGSCVDFRLPHGRG